LFAIPPNRVVAIPNPRKPHDHASSIASEHEPFFDKPVVLSVGRLEPQKNHAMLLHAFARTVLKHDVHLMILGEGSLRLALEKLAQTLGLGGRVLLPGFVQNPEPYMRRARVFALSSRNEGFPGVLVEAMDAGTAIVSTDCPHGPSEILDEGRFGTLVPPRDAGALAAALEAELDRPDVGHPARRAERAQWMEQFDPEIVTRSYLKLVQDVIAESEAAMLGSEVLRIK
jgi:glycosyltransferase involved in cell wall biosynthesis